MTVFTHKPTVQICVTQVLQEQRGCVTAIGYTNTLYCIFLCRANADEQRLFSQLALTTKSLHLKLYKHKG